MKKMEIKSDYYLWIFLIIAIVLTIVSIAFPFIINHYFSDWSKSGTFGDTFGALNAFFSGLVLTGVIVTILIQRNELKYQRQELSLQRTEMQETRKEFLLNRTTNLVYKQLDRFEKALSEFTFNYNGHSYVGNETISFLDDNKETVFNPIDKTEEYRNEKKKAVIKLLKLYTPNKNQIEKFALNAYNSVTVLKRLIYKTNLDVQYLNDLKNLFFENVGFINMGVIENISEVAVSELEYLTIDDYKEENLEVGKLKRSNIFLKSIKEFYHLRLTNENFDKHKAKWEESVGINK